MRQNRLRTTSRRRADQVVSRVFQMAGSSTRFGISLERLSLLPPYVLARVDELKSRLRAEGREVFDFGLGNPDGPSPAAVVARLTAERAPPGFQRYMPSRGLPELRAGDLRLVPAALRPGLRPRPRGGGHHRLEGGHRPPAAGAGGAGRLRAGARSRLSHPPLRRGHRRRRAGAGGGRARARPLSPRSRRRWRARPASPRG